jgi:hypothetical protein
MWRHSTAKWRLIVPNSLVGDEPKRHRLWQPEQCVRADASYVREARRRCVIAIVSLAASLALAVYCAWLHARLALAPPNVVGVTQDGWVFGGATRDFVLSPEMERSIWREILEAHLARTEKGTLSGLEDFSTPDTLAQVDQKLHRAGTSPYTVALTIVEDRVARRTPTKSQLLIRGRLTVVETQASSSSEVFLAAFFQRFTPGPANPTGWRMVALADSSRTEFYSDVLNRERAELLGPPPAPSGR